MQQVQQNEASVPCRFQEGVALGSLLYSVALAPGESTRIAVTEASSSTKTSSTETMSQSEQSDTSTTANRC